MMHIPVACPKDWLPASISNIDDDGFTIGNNQTEVVILLYMKQPKQ